MSQWARRLREGLRTGFWAVPALCVLLALALAIGLVAVDRHAEASTDRPFTFGAGPDGAREVLSAITSSMITFTGLVFSITIIVLQLTSSQFSPRVLRTFLRDRQTQLSLGVFVATFVYALMVLRVVNGGSDETFVPAIATTFGVALLLLSVGMFVAYIHHVATAIQVSSVIAAIGAEATSTLERCLPASAPAVRRAGNPAPASAAVTLELPSRRSGVVSFVDIPALVREAERADVVLSCRVALGSYVPEGSALLAVAGPAEGVDARACLRAIAVTRDRSMAQDVAFGLRQLVDIAERALSPSTNDPTTAVQVLDELHNLLRRLATRPLPDGDRRDAAGAVRLRLPAMSFAAYLHLALDEISQYGSESKQVSARVAALLDELAACALPSQRAVIEHYRRAG